MKGGLEPYAGMSNAELRRGELPAFDPRVSS